MKVQRITKLFALLAVLTLCFALSVPALAAAEEAAAPVVSEAAAIAASENDLLGDKAWSAALVVAVVAVGGAVAMGVTISKSAESMARQPEISGKINSAMMLGLVFIETLVIYALIVAILIIFVL